MSTSDAGGYAEPSRGSDLIDLFVQCLNGEGGMLTLSASCTGWEVYRMVSQQLPQKKGAQLTLHHLDLPLILHKELQAQGIAGKLPHSRAPMFQQISTLCGVLSNVCQSL
jgi:hypothetical protein